jgi:hypothetical protein
MQLPASEIDWCGFHRVGVWLVRLWLTVILFLF